MRAEDPSEVARGRPHCPVGCGAEERRLDEFPLATAGAVVDRRARSAVRLACDRDDSDEDDEEHGICPRQDGVAHLEDLAATSQPVRSFLANRPRPSE